MEPLSLLKKRERPRGSEEELSGESGTKLSESQVEQFFEKVPEFKEFLESHGVCFRDYMRSLLLFHSSGKRFVRIKPYAESESEGKSGESPQAKALGELVSRGAERLETFSDVFSLNHQCKIADLEGYKEVAFPKE